MIVDSRRYVLASLCKEGLRIASLLLRDRCTETSEKAKHLLFHTTWSVNCEFAS